MKIAVIGAGISGLVAAHHLQREHEITVFEANDYVGGHTNTIHVEHESETHWIDTGFIVLNDRNYPNFVPLLEELGVATQPSHMSFSVSDERGDFEYAGTPKGVFAQRSHLASPRFLRMIADLARFNREARSLLALPAGSGPTLREFLADGGYSEWFIDRLIVPQASAVWSADPQGMWSFPASFLARFFHNHGMLGFRDRPRWRTVSGGSRRYVEEITRPFAHRIRVSTPVRAVTRNSDGVDVVAEGSGSERFDEVVIATHSDQALAMLSDASEREHELLGAVAYQPNEAVLHTDERCMPRRRAAWASWNYHLASEPARRTQLTYWMNNLQSLASDANFLVTLNRSEAIAPEKIIRTIPYAHPVFTPEGVAAQARHGEISGVNRTHYCGAYWGWGFHEDGVVSALKAVERVGRSAAREAVRT
jgi:predicted NAD/FAD-binding protein